MGKLCRDIDDFLSWFDVRHGKTLVVGSKCYGSKKDRRFLYRDAIGIDLFDGQGVDFVHDLENPLPDEHGKLDHIDCCSVLEHCQRPWIMAKNIEDAMLPGATILVSVPFVWRIHSYPGDYWRISPQALEILFPRIKWKRLGYIAEGHFKKLVPRGEIDGRRYMMRSETVGFGFRCST